MKKAKIMLLSLAVIAVVSGALAFKAKKFSRTFYCYNNSAPDIVGGVDLNTTCTSFYTVRATATDGVNPLYHYTLVNASTLCTTTINPVTCPLKATTITIEP